MTHVMVIGEWVLTVLATIILINFILGGWAAHHANSPVVQGLRNVA